MRLLPCVPIFLILVSACQKEDGGAEIVAQVQDEIITRAEFVSAMVRRRVGNDPDAKRALLDELIERKKWLVQAKAAGFDRDPETVREYESLLIRRYQQSLQPTAPEPQLPTEQEAQAYYNAHADEFTTPERVRAAIIHVAAPVNLRPEARATKRQKIDRAHAAAQQAGKDANHFGALAVEFSEDQTSRYQGGDLGYLVRGMVQGGLVNDALLDAAFALQQPGDLSPVIETDDGFHFVKLMEKNPATQRPFKAVQSQIRSNLIAQQQDSQKGGVDTRLDPKISVALFPEVVEAIEVQIEEKGEIASPPLSPKN